MAVYLVFGDDDAKLDAWRKRLRRRAEDAAGPGALETFDARACAADEVAASLTMMTLTAAERFVLVDGVDGWKSGDLDALERELETPLESTILVLVARGKPPPRLAKAVERAGGELREYVAPKPWQLPKWATEKARDCGLTLDAEAAKALVAAVGPRQQRLAREIEKLAIAVHPRTRVSADEIRELAASDGTEQAYDLADAVVAGDSVRSFSIAERLLVADERPSKLVYPLARRLRDVQRLAEMLDAGLPESAVGRGMPRWALKRTLAQAKKADREALEAALCGLADLEVELRGGGSGLDEDTALSLTLAR